MTKLKIFNSARWDDDIPSLEAAINAWMERERLVILDIVQSAVGSHVLLSFLYEDAQDERRSAIASASVPEIFERTMEDSELDPDPTESHEVQLPEAELPY